MTILKRILAAAGLVSAMLCLSATANAIEVEFNGASADLAVVSSTANPDGTTTYRVVYTFDFSGWDPDNCVDTNNDGYDNCGAARATHLAAIDFSFGGSENPDAVLVSTTAPGDWTDLYDEVANANGCDGGGHNSVCALVDPLHSLSVTTGGSYQWVFDVTYTNRVPNDEDAAVRAWFVECLDEYECVNAGLMSLRTGVPEPGTLGMLGAGLILLGLTRRRRGALKV